MDNPETSEKIVLGDLLESWHNSLEDVDLIEVKKGEKNEIMKRCMAASDETLQELHGVCDIANLQCDGEPVSTMNVMERLEHFKSFPADDVNLVTLSHKQEDLSRSEMNNRLQTLLYKWLDEPLLHSLKAVRKSDPTCNIATPDLIINVAIHSPFDTNGQNGYKNLYVAAVYQVLGRQFLTELRDKIECQCDKVPVGEYSESPYKPPEIMSGDMYKSGFFFIDNVFYDDLRDPSSVRYSDVIFNWAKKPGRGLPASEQRDMEAVRFIDLTVKLGEPYLYQHQGNCEHVITFTDVKLLHSQDCHDISEYPMCVSQPLVKKSISCCVCWNIASWLSIGFSLSPDNEAYYCNTCFHSFHYDKDGHKISDFNAYPVCQ